VSGPGTQADLLFSQPGEWIGRTGAAKARLDIRRILVLKPDHIGDLLIAARGFALLRHYFPDAVIDLVCGPWNVGLAKRLAIFNDVYGVKLFHEVSGQQSDLEIAEIARREGLKRLLELRLGTYDLAVDMRFDQDSRSILPLIDARIYAGYGSVQTFPFLDIALPVPSGDKVHSESTEVVLTRRNFHRVFDRIGRQAVAGTGTGVVESARSSVDLDFIVTGAKSPAECGTVTADLRELGIALTALSIQPMASGIPMGEATHYSASTPHLTLVSGWASLEEWGGVWGVGARCRVRLELPPSRGEDTLDIRCDLIAHVNFANPLVTAALHSVSGEQGSVVEFHNPQNQGQCNIVVNRIEKEVRLASEPFRLRAGSYSGQLRLYVPSLGPQASLRIRLRGLHSDALLLERQVDSNHLKKGLVDLPLDCHVETGDELYSFEIETSEPESLEGTRIEMLALSMVRRTKLATPNTHMDTHSQLLALRIAMEFSSVEPFGQPDETGDRLAGAGTVTSDPVATVLARILGWQTAGGCVVGIALGCNSEIRKWPFQYFVELARELLEVEGVRLLFFGSRGERGEAIDACTQLGLDPALNVICGEVGLDELGEVLRPLDLFIASNTGSTHYAGRMGVRTIGIYAGTNHPREWGPVGDNTSWIYRDESCAVCSLTLLKDCRYGHRCLINLTPADVLAVALPEVLAVLSKGRPGAST
jgi:ADP-heptose:LPS heptosyltransferase